MKGHFEYPQISGSNSCITPKVPGERGIKSGRKEKKVGGIRVFWNEI